MRITLQDAASELVSAVEQATITDHDVMNALLCVLAKHGINTIHTPSSVFVTAGSIQADSISASNHCSNVDMLSMILRDMFPSDIWDDSAERTANRVINAWAEYNPREELDFEFTTFAAEKGQMIIATDIEFSSLCAHHLLPFVGKAHVGYIPNKLQVGLSKIPRLVDHWAKRPQVQERLGAQLGFDLRKRLEPMGVMVVLEARHSCMACRGVRKHNGKMVTSLCLGVFLTNPAARDEFFNLINRGDGI